MPIFQNSVINKQLQSQDKTRLASQWEVFKNHFHNLAIQNNIRNSKEEQYQGEFLIDLFVKVLGYTKNPTPDFTLTTEYKNVKDSKKADGAILINEKVKAVIELKGTNTTDLNKIEIQAFGYKNNQPECVYVITSNFEKLRFYIDNATEHIEFNLFTLSEKEFELLYLCLAHENIANDIPKKLKEQSATEEKNITKSLYSDYSLFKRELYQNLVKLNPGFDALQLFQKSQKLLDRFLFIFFAEDRNLLPTNLIFRINKEWRQLQEMRMNISLYERYKIYFNDLNTGATVLLPAFSQTAAQTKEEHQIFAYNGGLFQPDDVLDNIAIDDELLFTHTQKISKYDFQSEVDVNILGHIFENSLNELDEIKAQLEGSVVDKATTKRKKDGVFYTPKYITKYIIDNTIGKLCIEKRAELEITDEIYQPAKQRSRKRLDNLVQYRNWLLEITIVDPACGSGAFLNQALDFLINEHRYIDELSAKYNKDTFVLSDVEKTILENNLYGVDLNEESVEIARLSLWLRTAQKNRKLNDLSNNIKCGNSLIDNPAVAGEKAFNWQTAFPKVFEKGGFDVVIGNPPYGATFNNEEKEFVSNKYYSYQYKFESYLYFYELGLQILKQNGFLSYITPELFLRLEKSEKIRKYLIDNSKIIEVKLCGENVFQDVKVNSVVLTLRKISSVNYNFNIKFENDSLVEFTSDRWRNAQNQILEYEISENYETIIQNILKKSIYLDKLGECVQGLTAYDSYRGHTQDIIKTRAFHFNEKIDEFCGQWLDGKNLNRYSLTEGNEWLRYGDWLAAPREPKFFEKPRILFREIPGQNKKIQASFTDKKYYYGHSITPFILNENENFHISYILSIINSNVLSWYASIKCSNFSKKTFPKLNPKDIKDLPIPNISISLQQPFIENADLMLSLNKELQEQSQKFQRALLRKFELESLPKKLQDWYTLSYAEFIKELRKLKIKLTLFQEAEWEDYFINEAKKAKELKTQIDATDKTIDAMVYELYGLTSEEIAIVENS